MGAEIAEVSDLMAQHKKQKTLLNTMASPIRSMTNGNSCISDLGTPTLVGPSIVDVRPGLSIEDLVVDHTRVLNDDSAQAQFKQDGRSLIKTEPTNRMEEPSPVNVYTPSYLARAEGQRE